MYNLYLVLQNLFIVIYPQVIHILSYEFCPVVRPHPTVKIREQMSYVRLVS